MGLDFRQFRFDLVRPTLEAIGLWSEAAEVLITATAIIESRLSYLKQLNGPAVSIMQIEPFTFKDLRTRVATKYPSLTQKILETLYLTHSAFLELEADYLIGSLTGAIIFARLKYYFDKEPLPGADDIVGLAAYYKRVYNTPLGKADIKTCEAVFKSVIRGYPYLY